MGGHKLRKARNAKVTEIRESEDKKGELAKIVAKQSKTAGGLDNGRYHQTKNVRSSTIARYSGENPVPQIACA